MKVSVIIPSLYEVDKDYLKLCHESLRTSRPDWDIIVVTNGGVKPVLDFRAHHLHTRDQGQCNAVNIGAQVAQGDYLLVSNSDMYYSPGWDKNLRFDHDIFSPNLIEPTNNPGSAPPFVKADGGFTLDEFNRGLVDAVVASKTDSDVWKNKDVVKEEPGFNLPFFIKRDLYNFMGGYDVAYDPWGSNSDTDLQTRLNLAGVTPMRYRDVLVYHFSNKSGTFDGTHQDFYINNIEYFRDKFGFDRDELGSDVWYNRDMLPENKERIKYDQPRFSN
jgi:glycosyltransferase involved in cell wall biosynthesis